MKNKQSFASFRLSGLIGVLVGSLGVGSLGFSCQRQYSQPPETAIKASENTPKISSVVMPYTVSTREELGVLTETLVFSPRSLRGFENATMTITQGSTERRLKNFQLSLSRPGEAEQSMVIGCDRVGCTLVKNTIQDPLALKNLLVMHLKTLLNPAKTNPEKGPLQTVSGLSLQDPVLSQGMQLMVLSAGLVVFISFAILVGLSCHKIYNRYLARQPGFRQGVELAVTQAGLPVSTARTIAQGAAVLVIGPDEGLTIGRETPVIRDVSVSGQNQGVIEIYHAIVHRDPEGAR